MGILEKLQWRYATKSFDNQALLSEEQLHVLTEAFNLTATSYGLQPIKLVVIANKLLQKDLVEHSMNQKQIAEASHVLVFCIETNIDKDFVDTYFNRVHTVRQTPKDVLKPFQDFLIADFESKTLAEISRWATNQAYLALGNLLTVCAIEGIDACPMEGFNLEKYDEILGLKKQNLKSVLLLPVGFRSEKDVFSSFKKVRKAEADSIIHFN
ncbi:nitroreductase family protein [Bizionia sp. KMM 8389]